MISKIDRNNKINFAAYFSNTHEISLSNGFKKR